MKRTKILCPECMEKNLLHDEADNKTHCDNCGTEFIKTGEMSVRYK